MATKKTTKPTIKFAVHYEPDAAGIQQKKFVPILPCPRLQFVCEKLKKPRKSNGIEWTHRTRYEMAIPGMGTSDIRLSEGETEIIVSMGETNQQLLEVPFRDGVHASYDAKALKLPLVVIDGKNEPYIVTFDPQGRPNYK